jgi:MtrB/PioB family decaheme-associated outer membrane protein
MKPRLLSVLVANLFLGTLPAAAQDAMEWSGSASVGARYVDSDARDPSKLNEYRDLEDGTAGIFGFELRGRSEHNYLNAYGENLGRDDQYLDLKGGRYNTFRYRLYSDQLRHNFGSGPGALSPYSGIGGSTITATFPSTNVATWGSFDHSYKRRDIGAMFELQSLSPWYFRADANEVRREGINVFAGAQGTSPGNGFADLPSPIEYKTRNYAIEAGYSTRRSHFSVNLSHSTFENENDVLRWSNGFFGSNLDTTILPPDNELTRLAINGNLRQLALDSTLAARFTWSRLTSDVTLQPTMLSTGSVFAATNPSSPTFSGDIVKTSLGISLASHPAQALDTKLYFNWLKEENDSTRISFAPAAGSGLTGGSSNPLSNCNSTATNPCVPEMFEYEKRQLGAEAGWRVTRANKLTAGLEWTDIERERADFQKSEEWRLFAEWKNSSLDWLTGRIKYQFLTRDSDFNPHVDVLAANPMDLFVRRFDAANVDQNLVKLVLDATPAPRLDFGFEAIFKQNNYTDTPLGRTDDKRQEFYASVGYGDPRSWRVLLFGDIEYVKFDSAHRVGTGNPDPAAGSNATTYNWTAKNEDKAWQVGLGADWAVLTRLTLKASLIYAETNGSTDFSVQPGGPTTPLLPITNVDDTKRTSFTLRAVYEFDRHWEFTAGYSYEKYEYSDIGYDDTRYVVPPLTTAASYTTGQFAFQPYTANIVYAIAKYKF